MLSDLPQIVHCYALFGLVMYSNDPCISKIQTNLYGPIWAPIRLDGKMWVAGGQTKIDIPIGSV